MPILYEMKSNKVAASRIAFCLVMKTDEHATFVSWEKERAFYARFSLV
jgi:hypothetical protein